MFGIDVKNVRVISSAADPAMSAVGRIYQGAFPESERKPIEALDQMIQRRDYTFIVIDEDGVTIGFAILFVPAGSLDAALLEYLAVDAEHQSSGAGTALVRFVIELTDGRPLLVEVESSSEPLAQRRRAFYRRIGFKKLVGLDFILPLPNSPAMELMILHAPIRLISATLARWLRHIYVEVYSCKVDDSRLRSMASRMPSTILFD